MHNTNPNAKKTPLLFLGRTVLFIGLCAVLQVALVNYLLSKKDYAWGENEDFRARLSYVKQHAAEYNAVFLGSSIIKNHVNPIVFDSVVCSREVDMRSFNLGTDGMFVPTTFYMAEQLIRDTALKLQYLFVDYDGINDISRFLHHQKANYWISLGYLKFTSSAIHHSELSLRSKLKLIGEYSLLLLERNFGRGAGLRLSESNRFQVNADIDSAARGFTSLDDELNAGKGKNNEFIRIRHTNFVSDTSRLSNMLNMSRSVAASDTYINHPFVSKLTELIELGKQKNIQVFFLFQPRNADKAIHAEFKVLPVNNRINVSLDNALYSAYFHFDNKHLNNLGSRYFSERIADAFPLSSR